MPFKLPHHNTLDGISPVMSRVVGDKGDGLGVIFFRFAGLCGKNMKEQVNEIDEMDVTIWLHLLENKAEADEATATGDENGLSHGTAHHGTEASSRRRRPPRGTYR